MEPTKPRPFRRSTNKIETAREWKRWKQEFLIYLRLLGGYNDCSEEERALFLQNIMGTEAIIAMGQMHFDDPNEKKDMDILLMKFDEIFDPPLNEAEERYQFFSRKINKKETIEDYVSYLQEQSSRCNFGEQANKFIIDMIIRNVDEHLRKMIFSIKDANVSDVINCYKNYYINDEMMKTHHNENKKSTIIIQQKDDNHKQKRICSKCGNNHLYRECPAYHETCQKCFFKGHYTSKCKEKKINQNLLNPASQESQASNSQIKKSDQGQKDITKNKLVDCDWCEKKHIEGDCTHDKNCTRCDAFPHKICFNCKKNPHIHNCYYKHIVTLPSKISIQNNTSFQYPVNFDPLLDDYVRIHKNPNSTKPQIEETKKSAPPKKTFNKKNETSDCCVS